MLGCLYHKKVLEDVQETFFFGSWRGVVHKGQSKFQAGKSHSALCDNFSTSVLKLSFTTFQSKWESSFSFFTANSVFLITALYTCPKPPSPICLHGEKLHVHLCTSSNGQLIAVEEKGRGATLISNRLSIFEILEFTESRSGGGGLGLGRGLTSGTGRDSLTKVTVLLWHAGTGGTVEGCSEQNCGIHLSVEKHTKVHQWIYYLSIMTCSVSTKLEIYQTLL